MTLSRRHALWAFFVIQVACTLFFLRDSFGDVMGLPDSHETTANLIELAVSFCLLVGLAITGWELKRLSHREEKLQDQVSVASGAFADILQREFDSWGLSPLNSQSPRPAKQNERRHISHCNTKGQLAPAHDPGGESSSYPAWAQARL